MTPPIERGMWPDERQNGQADQDAACSSSSQRMYPALQSTYPSTSRCNGCGGRRPKQGDGDNSTADHSPHVLDENSGTQRTILHMRVSFSGDESDDDQINHDPNLEHHYRQRRTNAWLLSQDPGIPGFGNRTGQEKSRLDHNEWRWICEQLQDVRGGETNTAESTSDSKMTCHPRKASFTKQNGKPLPDLDAIGTWTDGFAYTTGLALGGSEHVLKLQQQGNQRKPVTFSLFPHEETAGGISAR